MKEKWTRLQFITVYNRTGIQKHLEKMASQGWLIEKIRGIFWRYRRIGARHIHIAVVYFPNATAYDPAPSEDQQIMQEYCARDGWNLAAQYGQMLIFWNDREAPVPIETDPITQVENIHRAMKKEMLPSCWGLTAIGMLQMFNNLFQLTSDPIQYFATPALVMMLPVWLCIILANLFQIAHYYFWRRKALHSARQGTFLESSQNRLTPLFIVLAIVCLLAAVLGTGRTFLVAACWTLPVVLIGQGLAVFLKHKGVSAETNRLLTSITVGLLSFLSLGLMVVVFLTTDGISSRDAVGTLEYNGWERNVYAEEIPLRVEDFGVTQWKEWSTEADGSETFLLGVCIYRQWALSHGTIPELEYQVIDVKAQILYELCLEELVSQRYVQTDAQTWGAEAAYYREYGDGDMNKYILCYPNRIIMIRLDWMPNGEHMALIRRKLGTE